MQCVVKRQYLLGKMKVNGRLEDSAVCGKMKVAVGKVKFCERKVAVRLEGRGCEVKEIHRHISIKPVCGGVKVAARAGKCAV